MKKTKPKEDNKPYKTCKSCKNTYDVEALCFADDPEHKICNGCFRQAEAKPKELHTLTGRKGASGGGNKWNKYNVSTKYCTGT